MTRVLETTPEEVDDVLVVEGVVDHPAGLAGLGQAEVAEKAKLMRHRGRGHVQERGQVADTEFPFREGVQDPDPGRIAEGPEDLGQGLDRRFRWHGPSGGVHRFLVGVEDLAGFGSVVGSLSVQSPATPVHPPPQPPASEATRHRSRPPPQPPASEAARRTRRPVRAL